MPDTTRIYCTRCQESVYNTVVDGQRIPIVLRLNVGQPADTGPRLDCNGEGVKLPSFVRSLMQTPLPRVELCMACVAAVFHTPLVTAAEDPHYDRDRDGTPDVLQLKADKSHVEQLAAMHAHSLHALEQPESP